jgi:hypothetical protein
MALEGWEPERPDAGHKVAYLADQHQGRYNSIPANNTAVVSFKSIMKKSLEELGYDAAKVPLDSITDILLTRGRLPGAFRRKNQRYRRRQGSTRGIYHTKCQQGPSGFHAAPGFTAIVKESGAASEDMIVQLPFSGTWEGSWQ